MANPPFGVYEELEISEHVSCCGISHIHEFPSSDKGATIAQRVSFIKEAVDKVKSNAAEYCNEDENEDSAHHCVEATLASYQLPNWEEALLEVGFKKTFSFLNSKSGNVCNVYHLETNE